MDTRQLEYFVAVADEGNFTRASARLFAAQSTVSAGIRSLERDLGTPLFSRSTKRVALTPTGEAVLLEARRTLESIERVRAAAAQTKAGIRGRVRVGIFSNLNAPLLASVFGAFRVAYPLVELQLRASPTGSTGMSDDVRRGRLDVAFMGLPAEDLGEFEVYELNRSAIVAVLPIGHPLAARTQIDLRDLADEPFVDSPPGFGNRVAVERLFASQGLRRRVPTEVADLPAIVSFVGAGLGVAIMPTSMIVDDPLVVLRPLAGTQVFWLLSAVSRRSPSPAVGALVELLQERFALAPTS